MKVEFKLDLDEGEKMLALRMLKSTDMAIILFEITHNLRREIEYLLDNRPAENQLDGYEVLDIVFNKINELIDDNNVNINEIID